MDYFDFKDMLEARNRREPVGFVKALMYPDYVFRTMSVDSAQNSILDNSVPRSDASRAEASNEKRLGGIINTSGAASFMDDYEKKNSESATGGKTQESSDVDDITYAYLSNLSNRSDEELERKAGEVVQNDYSDRTSAGRPVGTENAKHKIHRKRKGRQGEVFDSESAAAVGDSYARSTHEENVAAQKWVEEQKEKEKEKADKAAAKKKEYNARYGAKQRDLKNAPAPEPEPDPEPEPAPAEVKEKPKRRTPTAAERRAMAEAKRRQGWGQ